MLCPKCNENSFFAAEDKNGEEVIRKYNKCLFCGAEKETYKKPIIRVEKSYTDKGKTRVNE